MQQMCRNGIAVAFLILCSWQDIKTKMLSGKMLLLFGAGGILLNIALQTAWQQCIKGIVPGLVLLLFGKVSDEQIGYGDGAALIVLGFFLQEYEIILVLLLGLFLCAISAIVMFFSGKWKHSTAVPFMPFLTAGLGIKLLL